MKKSIFAIVLSLSLFTNKSYCQISDSTLIIAKPAFYLIPDTSLRAKLTSSLRGFLKARKDGYNPNPYVDPTYLKESVEPFLWLQNAETKSPEGRSLFIPTLLNVMPIGEDRYIIKLAYMAMERDRKDQPELKLITSLELRRSGERYQFYNTIEHNTKSYNKKQVGNISYIYPNQLDEQKARKMDRFNTAFAKKFNVIPIKIIYYKCNDPEQLFKMLGFDYIENMYYSLSGGLAYQWANTLFAGNNSELYEHELVHLYTSKLFEHKTREVDEGYATFIGGSGGLDLDSLARVAKKYISKNYSQDICSLATDFTVRVQGGVPITYILSGLVCRDIENKLGVAGVEKLFRPEPQEDYFDTLKRVNGIGRAEFPAYIQGLLGGY